MDKFAKYEVKPLKGSGDKFSEYEVKEEPISKLESLKQGTLMGLTSGTLPRMKALSTPEGKAIQREKQFREDEQGNKIQGSLLPILENTPGKIYGNPLRGEENTGFEGATTDFMKDKLASLTRAERSSFENAREANPKSFAFGDIGAGVARDMVLSKGLGLGAKALQLGSKIPGKVKTGLGIANQALQAGTEGALRSSEGQRKEEFLRSALFGGGAKVATSALSKIPMMSLVSGVKNKFIDRAKNAMYEVKNALPWIEQSDEAWREIVEKKANAIGEGAAGFSVLSHSGRKVPADIIVEDLDTLAKVDTMQLGGTKKAQAFVDDLKEWIGDEINTDGTIDITKIKGLTKHIDSLVKKPGVGLLPKHDVADSLKKNIRGYLDRGYLKKVKGYKPYMKKAHEDFKIVSEFNDTFKKPQSVLNTVKKMNRMITDETEFKATDYNIRLLKKFDKEIMDGKLINRIEDSIANEAIYGKSLPLKQTIRDSMAIGGGFGLAGQSVGLPGKIIGAGVGVANAVREKTGRPLVKSFLKLNSIMTGNANALPQGARKLLGEYTKEGFANGKDAFVKHAYLYKRNADYKDFIDNYDPDEDIKSESRVD